MEQPRLRPSPNSTYNYFNTKDIKHLTRLSLGLSHLRYQKLKHGLLDSLNPSEVAVLALKQTHFLPHCPSFINERSILLDNVSRLSKDKLPSCDTSVIKLLLYGDNSLDLVTNTLILNVSVDFVLSSKRFEGPLLYRYHIRCK